MRVLHDGHAAALFDHHQAVRAVCEVARHDNTDHALTILLGGRPEQRIDRRAETMLARPTRQPNAPLTQSEMKIGGRHVNVSGNNTFAVRGGCDIDRGNLAKNF